MSPSIDPIRYFHPVLPARALGKSPQAVTIAGRRYALWRDGSGRPAAVADACPHRNASLSRGRVRADGRLACGYHGWNFDADGCGQSPSQPKLKCETASYQVHERFGYLWMASRETPTSALPAIDCEGYTLAGAFPTRFEAPIHITLDNFTEDEHFPYVHQGFGWSHHDWPQVEYEAETFDDHTQARYVGPQRRTPILPLVGVKPGDLFHNSFVTWFDPVRTTYTSHWSDARTGEKRPIEAKTTVFMVPETEKTTRFHTFVFVKVASSSLFARMLPAVKLVARLFVMGEWWMDSRWVRHMADAAPTLQGLRLGKFDKTVIRNRKLLDSIYFGRTRERSLEVVA